MPNYTYNVEFTTKGWWKVTIVSVLAILVVAYLDKKGLLARINTKKLSLALIFYSALVGVFWIAMANVWPEWDPLYVLKAAEATSDPNLQLQCPGDEVSWILCPGGYLERFPYQIPLVIVDRVLLFVFGQGAYLAFEVINVICVAATLVLIGRITDALFGNAAYTNTTLLLGFTFLPLIFYVTFAYGNTISLPFIAGAVLFQVKYFNTGKLLQAIIALGLVALGLTFKSSMIYVLAAMVAAWIIHALKEHSLKDVLCLLLACICYLLPGLAVGASAYYLNLNPNIGEPKTVWFAMGTQRPSDESSNNYGWYNGYPLKWNPEDYDQHVIKEESISSIKQSISEFANDPAYAWTFFSRKFTSEWTDPLYESLLASNWSSHGADRPIMSERSISPVLRSIYYGKLHKLILAAIDGLQFLILAGCFAYLVRNWKTIKAQLIPIIITPVGVAILYLFWEAQSQYIMPAYILMLPLAGAGIQIISSAATKVIEKAVPRVNVER
ncbi:glycosyltransferase family 39 protein [Bifidobacterium sp. 79T10]|nr:glycosyltransferase family 39 protein [Bifidobacterium saguinibicoloris]